MTDRLFEAVEQYVSAVPPASAAAREAARRPWASLVVAVGVGAVAEVGVDVSVVGRERPDSGRRVPVPGAGLGLSPRLSGVAAAACVLAASLVAGLAVVHHLGTSPARSGTAAPAPARCSNGPYQLVVTDSEPSWGPYPLVAPFQFVVLQPAIGDTHVNSLRPESRAAVYEWVRGSWRKEAPLPVPAPNSGPVRHTAIVQFTSQYAPAQRYLLQVPFSPTPAAGGHAARGHSVLLCATVVIQGVSPGVTTTEAG